MGIQAAALAVAVVGTAHSIDASKKSARAQKEAGKIQTAAQISEDRSNLREQARQERIRREKIRQASENTGTGGGSREVGAINALQVQTEANTSRVFGQQTAAMAIGQQNQKMADAQVQQALGQGVANLGMQAFSASGGFDAMFAGDSPKTG